jgi:hypothetical protein
LFKQIKSVAEQEPIQGKATGHRQPVPEFRGRVTCGQFADAEMETVSVQRMTVETAGTESDLRPWLKTASVAMVEETEAPSSF